MKTALAIEQNMVKLSPGNVKKLGKIIRQYKSTPTQQLKMQIVDMFTPQIERKAAYEANVSGVSVTDYVQDLYLKLLENLDDIVAKSRYAVASLSKALNETQPADSQSVLKNSQTLEELTPEEECKIYYDNNAETLSDKAETILDTLRPFISKKKASVMDRYLNDSSFEQIADELGISDNRANTIYYEVIQKARELDKDGALSKIFFDDTKCPKVAVLNECHNEKPKQQDYDVEKILAEVHKHYPKRSVLEELDILARTQATSKELFACKMSQTKMRRKLQKNPDFKLKLELDERLNNDKFKQEAKKISVELFGKNIFEFV